MRLQDLDILSPLISKRDRTRLTDEKGLEEARVDDGQVARVPLSFVLPDSEPKVRSSDSKESERDDLEDESSHHDVPPKIASTLVICCTGDATTKSLKNEADDVAGDEEECICARLEA